jgi:hypothetical protein
MGRLSVRVSQRKSEDVKVVSLHIEHANGGKEEPQVLRMGKKGSLPVSVLNEPFVFFEAFPASTLVVVWGADLAREQKKDFVSLDALPLGRDEQTDVGDGSELVLELCAFNFGVPAVVVDKKSTFAPGELFGNFFSRSVCDVELLELRDLLVAEGLTTSAGAGSGAALRKLSVQVCFDTGKIVYRSPQVECATSVRLIDQDCSFLFGGDTGGLSEEDEAEPDADAEVLITISLFEKKLSRELLVGAVTVDLRQLVHIKGTGAPGQFQHLWLALVRKTETVGWLKCRVAASLEGDGHALLSRFGAAVRSLPMRVNFGDLLLMNNSSAMAKLIAAATGCPWDHVALVVCGPDPWRKPMLMEATREGVLAYPFEERVEAILRTEAVLGLRRLLDVERSPAFIRKVQAIVAAHHGKNYEESVATLIRANFKANHEESLDSLFCSELVAAAYQEFAVIGRDVISSNFSPKDFANEHFPTLRGRLDEIKRYTLRPSVIEHDIAELDEKSLRKTPTPQLRGRGASPGPAARRSATPPSTPPMTTSGGHLAPAASVEKDRRSPRMQPQTPFQVADLDSTISQSESVFNASFHLQTSDGREWAELLASPGPSRAPGAERPLSMDKKPPLQRGGSDDKSPVTSPRTSPRLSPRVSLRTSSETWSRASPASIPSEQRSSIMRRSNRSNEDSPPSSSSSLPKNEGSAPVLIGRRGNGSNEELPLASSLPTPAELEGAVPGSPQPRLPRTSGVLSPPSARRDVHRISAITVDSGEEDSEEE